jgi:hypothetical protein
MFSRVWQSYEVPKVPNVPIKWVLSNSLSSLDSG